MRKIRFGSSLIASCLAFAFVSTATAGAVLSDSFNQSNLAANDDSSSPAVPIGFTIEWDGAVYSNIYVNNNGNVTFDSAQAAYTPGALNTLGKPVIAPFFADVDTRSSGSPVSYGTGTYQGYAAFGANWVNVSCYIGVPTANNSYQMVLVDRSDTGSGNFDIVLNYDKLAWESGSANGGSTECLGGVPARAGFYGGGNNNKNYYELPGSGTSGAMLDTGTTPLITGHSAGEIEGRYLFAIRNGQPAPLLKMSTHLASPSAAGVPVPLTATINSPTSISSSSNISFCANASTTDASCTGGTLLCQATLPAGATTASCDADLPAGATHQLSAYFPGDVDHASGVSSLITHSVGQFSQSISFTSTAASGANVGSTYSVAAVGGGSGNAVVFSIDASSNAYCSLANSNVVTFLTTGPCQINADQAGSAEYAAAPTQSQIVTPGKSPQTITFTSVAPLAAKMEDSYTVAATGGASGNPVRFSIDATSAGICSINASTVSFEGQGACLINANQLGNDDYDDATQARQTVSIAQGGSGVSIASTPNPSMPRQTVTLTVSVAFDATKRAHSQAKAAAVPTGTVEIFDGSTSLGVASLVDGAATLSTDALAFSGDHSITALYRGDSNYAATQSLVFTQTVMNPAPVPLLSQSALVLLSLVLGGFAAVGGRRKTVH